jgi:hypothetical protein
MWGKNPPGPQATRVQATHFEGERDGPRVRFVTAGSRDGHAVQLQKQYQSFGDLRGVFSSLESRKVTGGVKGIRSGCAVKSIQVSASPIAFNLI